MIADLLSHLNIYLKYRKQKLTEKKEEMQLYDNNNLSHKKN